MAENRETAASRERSKALLIMRTSCARGLEEREKMVKGRRGRNNELAVRHPDGRCDSSSRLREVGSNAGLEVLGNGVGGAVFGIAAGAHIGKN